VGWSCWFSLGKKNIRKIGRIMELHGSYSVYRVLNILTTLPEYREKWTFKFPPLRIEWREVEEVYDQPYMVNNDLIGGMVTLN
jgi:hypothetical protein